MIQNKLAQIFLILSIMLGAMVPVALGFSGVISIPEFLLLTAIVSTAVMSILVVATGKVERLLSYLKNPRDLGLLVGIGLFQYAVWGFGFLYAERIISVSLAAAIYRTFPILMLLFIPYFLREKITKFQIIALSLAFLGLYLAVSGGNLMINTFFSLPAVGLMFVVAICSAFTSVLIKKHVFDIASSMLIFSIANLVFFGLIFFLGNFSFVMPSTSGILGIIYMGVIGNAILGVLYYSALRMLKTTFVTNLYFLSPFLTFIYSAIIFGDVIRTYYIIIAVLVGLGLLLQKFDLKGGTYLPKNRTGLAFFDVTSAFVNSEETVIHNVIKSGGKVLAVKLDSKHREKLGESIRSLEGYKTRIYTDLHDSIRKEEALFIRKIVGVETNEMVLLGAGKVEQCEQEIQKIIEKTELG